ncbi:MAG TPA: GIY-YIG nuclease family protein [Bacteroidota bacterium]|nr:GIY-YIG nuclease family protein [Bacteroidota bacterium]
MYYVYILYSEKKKKYYIGSTNDVIRRLAQHNSATKGYTSAGQPWQLKYREAYPTKLEALRREKEIKKMKSRKFIEALIRNSIE